MTQGIFWSRRSGIYRLTLFPCGPHSRDGKLIWRVDLVSCLIACSLFQSRDTFSEQDGRSRTKPRQMPGDLLSPKNAGKRTTTNSIYWLEKFHLIAVGLNRYPVMFIGIANRSSRCTMSLDSTIILWLLRPKEWTWQGTTRSSPRKCM